MCEYGCVHVRVYVEYMYLYIYFLSMNVSLCVGLLCVSVCELSCVCPLSPYVYVCV